MNDSFNNWLKQETALPGVLGYVVQFPDRSVVCNTYNESMNSQAIEKVLGFVAKTYQQLTDSKESAIRLKWTFQKAVLNCARRKDGTIFGVLFDDENPSENSGKLESLINKFLQLPKLDS